MTKRRPSLQLVKKTKMHQRPGVCQTVCPELLQKGKHVRSLSVDSVTSADSGRVRLHGVDGAAAPSAGRPEGHHSSTSRSLKAARLCRRVSGDDLNIGWSRNGEPVRPDGRDVLVSSDGSLILNRVQPEDEGTYTCPASTEIYSVSAAAQITVTKHTQRGAVVPPHCSYQPELADCQLIVYVRLCSNSYYAGSCCASCTRHSQSSDSVGRLG